MIEPQKIGPQTIEPRHDADSGGPGAAEARARGCACSVLANAAFRAGAAGQAPLIDPTCPLHNPPPDTAPDPVLDAGSSVTGAAPVPPRPATPGFLSGAA